jgi:hypothetical protein
VERRAQDTAHGAQRRYEVAVVEEAQQRSDGARVELRAGGGLQLRARLRHRTRGAIRPPRTHGVERIGHRYDAASIVMAWPERHSV